MPEMTVKVGHVGPTTGPQAHLAKDHENGARLAIDDANAKGVTIDGKKVKFEMDAQDDQADPKQGPVVAQKLVDDKVAGVVGNLNSGTAIPASKIYSDAGIPQGSPPATACARRNGRSSLAGRQKANIARKPACPRTRCPTPRISSIVSPRSTGRSRSTLRTHMMRRTR